MIVVDSNVKAATEIMEVAASMNIIIIMNLVGVIAIDSNG